MNPAVFLHITMVDEGPTALEAGKRTFARVLAKMAHEIAATLKYLSAVWAFVDSDSITPQRVPFHRAG